jgi:hypothetical protein
MNKHTGKVFDFSDEKGTPMVYPFGTPISTESPEEKKARLLAELEELNEQEELTEKQQKEAQEAAELQEKKDKLWDAFNTLGSQEINFVKKEPDLDDYNKSIIMAIENGFSKFESKRGENLTTLSSEPVELPEDAVSTPNALKSLAGVVALGVAIFIGLMFMLSGEGSSSVENMFNAFPLRTLLNVVMIGSSLGIALMYLRFFHPSAWGYFHSKIHTQCTPQKDWNDSPPQFRIQFVADTIWKWVLVCALFYLVIFA